MIFLGALIIAIMTALSPVPTARLIAPAILLIPFVLFYCHYVDWPEGFLLAILSAMLLIAAVVSALACPFNAKRSLVMAGMFYAPFLYMAFSHPNLDQFSRWYFQFVAIFQSLWVWRQCVRGGGSMGPHSMDFSEGVQAFGLMLLWPLLFGWAKESRGWSRIWYWGLTAAAMGAIFLLFERAIFLIMVVGLFLLVANDRKTIFLGVVVLIIIALWYIPSETIHSYLAWYRFVDFEADSPRTLIHELAMDALSRNFWFGVGPGNARNVLFGVVPYFGAHNTTLTVALEAGIIGAVLITLLHVYIVYLAIKVWFRGGMGPYYAVSLLSIPACSFVYDWHHAPEVTFMFCIILVQARHMMKASFERSPGRVYWYNNRYLMVPEHPGP